MNLDRGLVYHWSQEDWNRYRQAVLNACDDLDAQGWGLPELEEWEKRQYELSGRETGEQGVDEALRKLHNRVAKMGKPE